MNVLFSPVGLTDPISNFRDGAMLHICRNFEIDKVYLYISKEIYEYHLHDNRYLYCLNKLSRLLGREIENELIIREDMSDVHLFDVFINDFRNIISSIRSDNPEAQIYLNVSSGSPAMKSALQILAAFREFDMIPIQVATPEKKSNPHVEDKLNYNPEEQWECNEDNSESYNRCTVSENVNFLLLMKKQMLAELINNYDYNGAMVLAGSMKNSLSTEFLELMDGAVKRYNLNCSEANRIFKNYGIKILETEQSNHAPLTEYLLRLDIKAKRGEYSDFLVGVTPLISDLFEIILRDFLKFDINSYVINASASDRKWDMSKLQTNTKIMKVFSSLNNNGSIYSSTMLNLIEVLSGDANLNSLCNSLRTVDKTRNSPAHEIVCITDDWIKRKTGFNSHDIIMLLRKSLNYTKINIEKDFFNSYNKMNEILIQKLEL